MAPMTKSNKQTDAKQPTKSTSASSYLKKLRSATVVTPSRVKDVLKKANDHNTKEKVCTI